MRACASQRACARAARHVGYCTAQNHRYGHTHASVCVHATRPHPPGQAEEQQRSGPEPLVQNARRRRGGGARHPSALRQGGRGVHFECIRKSMQDSSEGSRAGERRRLSPMRSPHLIGDVISSSEQLRMVLECMMYQNRPKKPARRIGTRSLLVRGETPDERRRQR